MPEFETTQDVIDRLTEAIKGQCQITEALLCAIKLDHPELHNLIVRALQVLVETRRNETVAQLLDALRSAELGEDGESARPKIHLVKDNPD